MPPQPQNIPPHSLPPSSPSLIAFLTLLLTASLALASDPWTLTTSDFKSRPFSLTSIDSQSLTSSSPDARIPLDDFLQLQRPTPPSPPSTGLVIHLTTGDRLTGQPLSTADEKIRWRNPALGDLSLPLRQILAITNPAASLPDSPEPRKEDSVQLANGDSVRGIVTDIAADKITVQTDAGPTPVPLDTIIAVYFAATPVPASAPTSLRLTLMDSSQVTASSLLLADDQLKLKLFDDPAPRTLSLQLVASIEQLNGPVAWLSQRTPTENVQIPLLDLPWPARMDATVRNQPIRFNQTTYRRGIGVHAYSRLTYPLDGHYAAFRTQYAIDGDWPYADVTVRIKLDNKTVHEEKNVRSNHLSPTLTIPLNNAKTLTLEVDYGANNDTQDRFNWIEPALLRKLPQQVTSNK